MVRKMRIGQLHAATMTIAGLTEIDPAFSVFAIPLFFSTDDELLHVLKKLEPELRRRLEEKGFVLLHWGHGGWLHLFSTKTVTTVEDFKTVKFFVWAGDDRMVRWWKDNGFRPVALAGTDIMPSLQTGVIEALPSTPLAALSLQWFRSTPNMLDLRFAPLVGASVMTTRAWNKISDADQQVVLKTARKAQGRLFNDIPQEDLVALSEMQKRGLAVTAVAGTPKETGWKDLALRFAERMRQSVVPTEILDAALRERDAYRRQTASSTQP
jgi:TRAP-type C4-dicarboxylate transport system substrate-binding protein